MNIGQLVSITHCESCHMPLAIFQHESEVICKFCGTKNNLVVKDGFLKEDSIKMSTNPIHKLKLKSDLGEFITVYQGDKEIVEFQSSEILKLENSVSSLLDFLEVDYEWANKEGC